MKQEPSDSEESVPGEPLEGPSEPSEEVLQILNANPAVKDYVSQLSKACLSTVEAYEALKGRLAESRREVALLRRGERASHETAGVAASGPAQPGVGEIAPDPWAYAARQRWAQRVPSTYGQIPMGEMPPPAVTGVMPTSQFGVQQSGHEVPSSRGMHAVPPPPGMDAPQGADPAWARYRPKAERQVHLQVEELDTWKRRRTGK